MVPRVRLHEDTTVSESLIAQLVKDVETEGDTIVGRALVSALPADVLWHRYDQHEPTHITHDGDLVLDIRDVFTPSGFWHHELVRFWSLLHSFNSDGWNNALAYWRLFEWALFPAIAELDNGPELLDAFDELVLGGPVPDLPEVRVLVSGRALMEYLGLLSEAALDKDNEA